MHNWRNVAIVILLVGLGVSVDIGVHAHNGVSGNQSGIAHAQVEIRATQAVIRRTQAAQQRQLYAGCIAKAKQTAQIVDTFYNVYTADVTRAHQGTAAERTNSRTEEVSLLAHMRSIVRYRYDIHYVGLLPAPVANAALVVGFACPAA